MSKSQNVSAEEIAATAGIMVISTGCENNGFVDAA